LEWILRRLRQKSPQKIMQPLFYPSVGVGPQPHENIPPSLPLDTLSNDISFTDSFNP
jgi:hypothetical protein